LELLASWEVSIFEAEAPLPIVIIIVNSMAALIIIHGIGAVLERDCCSPISLLFFFPIQSIMPQELSIIENMFL